MGMTKNDISRKLDEIVAFSGCERYIDTPVKRYSSGMTVRLGFAVAAHLEPDILVVDEVLAVGDAEFQKKAIGKMQDVSRGEGRTVLFVSHNMMSVQRLCKHGILLENGSIKYTGDISDTIHSYLEDSVVQSEYKGVYDNHRKINLLYARVSPATGGIFYTNTPINIDFHIVINQAVDNFVCGFNIYSSYNYPLARADYNDLDGRLTLPQGEYEFHFQIPADRLSNGEYRVVFDIAEKTVKNYAEDDSMLTFNVEVDNTSKINAFSEKMPIKSSIIRENWLVSYQKL